jgi:IMP dehydrogenase/GMP reductase
MSKIRKTYDRSSVYMLPHPSSVNHRDDVDLSVDLGKFKLKIPIIISPMRHIVNPELCVKIDEWGGIGILHRFVSDEEFMANISQVMGHKFGVAVGLNDNRYKMALDLGANILCVDVANGYLSDVKDFCWELFNYITDHNYDTLLMAGNVITEEGAFGLSNSGVDLVRVGIGTGGLCSTRQKTKIGQGQFTTLQNVSGCPGCKIVSDGGIKEPGDVVLDLASGADLVLMGSLFGQTYESDHDGEICGMASEKLQQEFYDYVDSVEGKVEKVEKIISFDGFMHRFVKSMKSSMTYQGCANIQELKDKATFVVIQ